MLFLLSGYYRALIYRVIIIFAGREFREQVNCDRDRDRDCE